MGLLLLLALATATGSALLVKEPEKSLGHLGRRRSGGLAWPGKSHGKIIERFLWGDYL